MFSHDGHNRLPLRCYLSIAAMIAVLLPAHTGWSAGASGARECLSRAALIAQSIEMTGDQSAARRYLASTLAPLDPNGAMEMAGGIRRPSDAARALGAVAVGFASTDSVRAAQAVSTASRLLQRIVEPAQREAEERLLLGEVSILGKEAVSAAPELPAEQARQIAATSLARSEPAAALALLEAWGMSGNSADEVRAAAVSALLDSDPARATNVADAIVSERLRTSALWEVANSLPPTEAAALAQRGTDPITYGSVLTAAAVRAASADPEAAESLARQVLVAPDSAMAAVAAALPPREVQRALALSRALPPQPRGWALSQLAISLAAVEPDLSRELLQEADAGPEVVRLALAQMAAAQPTQAAQVALSLPAGDAQEAALCEAAAGLAASDPRRAGDLIWAIRSPQERGRAVARVAPVVAVSDTDAATSLLGLMPDTESALRVRAKLAVAVASRDPEAAIRLLATLPQSGYRTQASLDAAAEALRAGRSAEQALMIATLGLDRDAALRWLLPTLAQAEVSSPVNVSDLIDNSYLHTLALVDAARRLQRLEPRAKPAPARAQMVRVIAEWEGM